VVGRGRNAKVVVAGLDGVHREHEGREDGDDHDHGQRDETRHREAVPEEPARRDLEQALMVARDDLLCAVSGGGRDGGGRP